MKTTTELINEIKRTPGIAEFLKNNREDLTNPELKSYLAELLNKKQMSRSEAIRAADLSSDYAYQIFSGKKNPSRDKLLRLALAMNLTLDESSRLFKLADTGELYPRTSRDAVLIFCIEHGCSVMETNELLYDLEMYTLA